MVYVKSNISKAISLEVEDRDMVFVEGASLGPWTRWRLAIWVFNLVGIFHGHRIRKPFVRILDEPKLLLLTVRTPSGLYARLIGLTSTLVTTGGRGVRKLFVLFNVSSQT
jgi:hypothetical protein